MLPKTKQKPTPPPTRSTSEKRIPKQASSLNRVAAVFAATREALIEVGYGGLSMVDIAARAGITHSSIYHYFKSVDDILAAMMQEVLDETNKHGNELFELATSSAELIEACIHSWRISFHYFSKLPEARPLYAATRNVPKLAEIEQADYKALVQFMTSHFKRVLPRIDEKAVRINMIAIVSLAVPMYEIILEQPEEQRMAMIGFLEDMVRMRLEKTVAAAF
jgi:AcrR family transcriptional regulator